MAYVLVRSDGKYVAKSGFKNSYTKKLEQAQIFPTREAADLSRCPENESVREVIDILRSGRW